MSFKIWLDDQSFDPETPDRHPPKDYVAAETSQQAIAFVKSWGLPEFVDFDHDLGGDDTSMKFLRYLEMNYNLANIKPFEYNVHSANGEGSKNIKSFMESWRKIYTLEKLE